jgi:hypothetical protein
MSGSVWGFPASDAVLNPVSRLGRPPTYAFEHDALGVFEMLIVPSIRTSTGLDVRRFSTETGAA